MLFLRIGGIVGLKGPRPAVGKRQLLQVGKLLAQGPLGDSVLPALDKIAPEIAVGRRLVILQPGEKIGAGDRITGEGTGSPESR